MIVSYVGPCYIHVLVSDGDECEGEGEIQLLNLTLLVREKRQQPPLNPRTLPKSGLVRNFFAGGQSAVLHVKTPSRQIFALEFVLPDLLVVELVKLASLPLDAPSLALIRRVTISILCYLLM
jgi:hypothetical protein